MSGGNHIDGSCWASSSGSEGLAVRSPDSAVAEHRESPSAFQALNPLDRGGCVSAPDCAASLGRLRDFREEWAAYLSACQARKQRIAAARRAFQAEVAAARERLCRVLSEPAPATPTRK